MRVVLDVIEGTQVGKRFEFDRHDTFMVGREKKVHFCIPDDGYFSRYHFMIEANPPQCFLRDLGSTNGTWVNGQKLPQDRPHAHLKDGDIIKAGHTLIRVRVSQEAPAAQSATLSAAPTMPTGGGGPAQVSMDTTLSAGPTVQAPGASRALHCGICKRVAQDTVLVDLADTRMASYVCPDCRAKHRRPGQPVPNFEVLGELGKGALGAVYKARRISTGVVVALKTIPPDMAGDKRAVRVFVREMEISARLKHPNIASVIEIGDAAGDLWIASEYVGGVDAAALAGHVGGKVPLRDAVEIICQTLDGLEYAHRQNLVHRDVKPQNILVTGEPGGYQARLADFGLMKNMDEAGMTGITREGEIRGTIPFMPPEQVLDCRFVKPAGDIYQAGATLYWMLTGHFVHDFDVRDPRGERTDPFLVILDEDTPTVPIRRRDASVPLAVAEVIETALRHEPEDRYDTAAEMADALRTLFPPLR